MGYPSHCAARARKPTLTPGRPSPGKGESRVAPATANPVKLIFFQQGQKKLAKKRGKGSSGSGKKKAKKAKDLVPKGNHTVAGTH